MIFLAENIIIYNSQNGFRDKHSCLTNFLDSYNDVFNIYDEANAVDIICLDSQNTFDKVFHKRLKKDLSCMA